jgi:hypothetical protein
MSGAEDPMVNVFSPEDPMRARAIAASEKARALAAQLAHAEGHQWLNNIEPDARAYFEASQQAEKALLLSIAISVMRIAGSAPPEAEAEDSASPWTEESGVSGQVVGVGSARGKGADDPDSGKAKGTGRGTKSNRTRSKARRKKRT